MNITEAYMEHNEPEPTPEEHVTHTCPNCTKEVSSSPRTACFSPEVGAVEFKHFAGYEFIDMTDAGETIVYCPKGCTDYFGNPKAMLDIVASGNYTPHDRWRCANALVELDKAQEKVKELEEAIEEFSGMY